MIERPSGLIVPNPVNKCLQRLISKVDEVPVKIPDNTQETWMVLIPIHLKAWLLRVVELAHSMQNLHNKESYNAAITLGRPLMETIVVFVEFLRLIEDHMKHKNVKGMALFCCTMFNKTKNPHLLETQRDCADDPHMQQLTNIYKFTPEEYQKALNATNINTILEFSKGENKESKRATYFETIFRKALSDIRRDYSFFSEYVHSSGYSASTHYVEYQHNEKGNIISLKLKLKATADDKQHFDDCIGLALKYVLSFESAYEKFEALVPQIAEKFFQ